MARPEVLLVEDDSDDLEMMRAAFQEAGINGGLAVVRDGQAALDYLFESPGRSSPARTLKLIVLDLNLPKMDGLEVLRRLRADERTRHIPTVILTSVAESFEVKEAYRIGVNSFLVKPLEYRKFLDSVAELARYWKLNLPPK